MSLFEKRELGVLLHPVSLSNHEPIGTLGQEAYEFIDWLELTGCSLWQILPLCPNGKHNSPYFSPCSFCGNPWLIDLTELSKAKLVNKSDIPKETFDSKINFPEMKQWKEPLLLKAARKFLKDKKHDWKKEFDVFCKTQTWSDDAALFYVLQDHYKNAPWWEWEEKARRGDAAFLKKIKTDKKEELLLQKALFFFFEKQWFALKAYANKKKIRVLGDLPIYVDENSVEVWLNQKFFKMDENGHMKVVSGVPPDAFSETGQLWGNPIYDWDVMEKENYSWWEARLKRLLELTDIVRIDHFRGLSAYWEVPGDSTDARDGKWVQGPGQKFFDAMKKAIPGLPIIVEDLGSLDDAVFELRDQNEFFGMRVLQFGFDDEDPNQMHLPHTYNERSVAYTGNHDLPPTRGWWEELNPDKRKRVAKYFNMSVDQNSQELVWALMEKIVQSQSKVAILPIQDILCLGSEARINHPATFIGNWAWRMPKNRLNKENARALSELRKKYRE